MQPTIVSLIWYIKAFPGWSRFMRYRVSHKRVHLIIHPFCFISAIGMILPSTNICYQIGGNRTSHCLSLHLLLWITLVLPSRMDVVNTSDKSHHPFMAVVIHQTFYANLINAIHRLKKLENAISLFFYRQCVGEVSARPPLTKVKVDHPIGWWQVPPRWHSTRVTRGSPRASLRARATSAVLSIARRLSGAHSRPNKGNAWTTMGHPNQEKSP